MKCVDWIHLAQDMDHCWAFVRSLINFWVQYDAGYFVTNKLPALQKVLSSIPGTRKRPFCSLQSADRLWDPRSHQPNWKTIVFSTSHLCFVSNHITFLFLLVLYYHCEHGSLCRQRNDWQITSDFLWLHLKKFAVCMYVCVVCWLRGLN
jgi:hypothetical protein